MSEFDGAVAIVTGGESGLGPTTAALRPRCHPGDRLAAPLRRLHRARGAEDFHTAPSKIRTHPVTIREDLRSAELAPEDLADLLLAEGFEPVDESPRMSSGTAYGAVILHAAPEAAAGGPLAFVRTGDIITVDVENRTLKMDVSDEELQSPQPEPRQRGRVRGARPRMGEALR